MQYLDKEGQDMRLCKSMMLGKSIKDFEALQQLNLNDYIIETKYDGCRLGIEKCRGDITVYTRGGKILDSELLKDSMRHLDMSSISYIDAELIVGHGFVEDRRKATGVVNTTISNGENLAKRASESHITLVLFDYIDYSQEGPELPYIMRRHNLDKLVEKLHTEHSTAVDLIQSKSHIVESHEECLSRLNSLINVGYEGLVLKHKQGKYEYKRSKNLLKLKRMNYITLTCVACTAGEGKYEGMIGALVFEHKGKKVFVGSGLTDAMRVDPHDHIGKAYLIKYESVSYVTGTETLIQPTIVRGGQ